MPPELNELAVQRAAALGMNFSAYVNHLIRMDMATGGSMLITPARVIKASGSSNIATHGGTITTIPEPVKKQTKRKK